LVKVTYNASLFLSFELVVGCLFPFPTMHTMFDFLCQVNLWLGVIWHILSISIEMSDPSNLQPEQNLLFCIHIVGARISFTSWITNCYIIIFAIKKLWQTSYNMQQTKGKHIIIPNVILIVNKKQAKTSPWLLVKCSRLH
jgi:hypothetical protein